MNPRRRYGDQVRRILRDTYEMHPSTIRVATTGHSKHTVDNGFRFGDTAEHTAMRVYEDEYDIRLIDADGRPLRFKQHSKA